MTIIANLFFNTASIIFFVGLLRRTSDSAVKDFVETILINVTQILVTAGALILSYLVMRQLEEEVRKRITESANICDEKLKGRSKNKYNMMKTTALEEDGRD